MIPFNVPPYTGLEDKYVKQALTAKKSLVMEYSEKDAGAGLRSNFLLKELSSLHHVLLLWNWLLFL